MNHLKTISVPARTREVVDFVTCDICKQKLRRLDMYEVEEPTVYFSEGHRYPDGGAITTIRFDLCKDCFTEKLIPWLLSQGAIPRTEEWLE